MRWIGVLFGILGVALSEVNSNSGPPDNDSKPMELLGAVSEGNLAKVIELFTVDGMDINAEARPGWTPLAAAASAGQEEVLSWLLDHGADMTLKGRDTRFIHYLAIEEAQLGILKLLVSKMPKPPLDTDNWNMLHRAAAGTKAAHREITHYLVKEKVVEVDSETDKGMTPLMVAAHQGLANNVRLLLSLGANPNHKDKNGRAALMYLLYGYKVKKENHEKDEKIRKERDEEHKRKGERVFDFTLPQDRDRFQFKDKDRKKFHSTIATLVRGGAQAYLMDNFGGTPMKLALEIEMSLPLAEKTLAPLVSGEKDFFGLEAEKQAHSQEENKKDNKDKKDKKDKKKNKKNKSKEKNRETKASAQSVPKGNAENEQIHLDDDELKDEL
eukprot:g43076.t1